MANKIRNQKRRSSTENRLSFFICLPSLKPSPKLVRHLALMGAVLFILLIAAIQISWICDFVSGFKGGFVDIQDTLGYTEGCDEGVYDYWETPKVFWRFGYEMGMGRGAVDYYKQIRKDLKNGYRHGAYLGNRSFEN